MIGGCNERRPTGSFAKSQIPIRLYQDVIQAAARRAHSEGTLDDRKAIFELFAGATALGTVARHAKLVLIVWRMTSVNRERNLSTDCMTKLTSWKITLTLV